MARLWLPVWNRYRASLSYCLVAADFTFAVYDPNGDRTFCNEVLIGSSLTRRSTRSMDVASINARTGVLPLINLYQVDSLSCAEGVADAITTLLESALWRPLNPIPSNTCPSFQRPSVPLQWHLPQIAPRRPGR